MVLDLLFRQKEQKEKDKSKKSKRRPILFSKKDQEISELVTIFSQREISLDSSSGQDT
jgi:hypothetical protein